jgi:hypothetical protein
MTSPLMKPTLVGGDMLHELVQPLNKLAYVSDDWGPLLMSLSYIYKKGAEAPLTFIQVFLII